MRWTLLLAVMVVPGLVRAEKTWKPYAFKGNERFEYSLLEVEKGEKTEGHYVIDLGKEGERFVVKLEGKFGEYEGSSTVKVGSGNDLQKALMTQMFFNPWMAPLSVTLFAQGMMTALMTAFTAGGEEGSKHVMKGENETIEYLVESCSFQGREGRKYVMKKNGEVKYESCVVDDIALPVYLKTINDEGEVYELKLEKYEEKS